MIMRFTIILVCIATSFLQAQSVKVFSEKGVDWKSVRSFSVAAGELVTVLKKDVSKEKVLDEIRKSISAELESRGLENKTDNPDLLIDFTAEVVETSNVEDIGPLGQAPADQPGEMQQSRTWTQERKQGSLAIEVSDRNSKTIWRSSITIEFGSDELQMIFNAAIGKSLKKFPAGKK